MIKDKESKAVIAEANRKRSLDLTCAIIGGLLFTGLGVIAWFKGESFGPSMRFSGPSVPLPEKSLFSLFISLFGIILLIGAILKIRRK